MSARTITSPYLSVEEYLAAEELSPIKYEYLGGVIYAMAGAGEPHNRIFTNLIGTLHTRLRGRRCEAFGADMKVRLKRLQTGLTYFYYPDAMIACNPNDVGHGWREQPAALFEIISESTRQIDEREKRLAYLDLPSLEAYMRIEQDWPEVIVDRRTVEGWIVEIFTGLDAVMRLPTLEIELSLAELYERITFPKPSEESPESEDGASA